MVEMSGGEALLRTLMAEQIDTVFGLTGGKLSPLLGAIAREPDLRFIGTRHEGGAALMAAGFAAASGRLGVVVGECGSGAVNLVPGIAVANANSVPLLAITSNNQHAVSYPSRGMFATMDTQALFRPVTKWGTAIHHGQRIPELVRTALREAHTGRRGAVHLDVPQDILRGTFAFDEATFALRPYQYRLTHGPAGTAAQIDAAARLLRESQRPLLIAGGGVAQSGAASEFRELAALLEAAATATQTGIGVVASTDEHFVGLANVTSGPAFVRACREADVILAIGCRLSPWLWDERGPLFGSTAKIIQVSTDPSSIGSTQAVEVGMLADARSALQGLLGALGAGASRPARREWLAQLRSVYAERRAQLAVLASDATSPMHPAALASELGQCLPADAIVAYDGGHTTFWSNDFTPFAEPQTRFNEIGMTQLGFGLPFAIAARLRHPDRPVFNFTGDGAFGFTIQELDTARRYGLPVVNVIHNNASWGVIKVAHQRGYGFTMGDDLEGTDYAAIARGFGCYGEVVTKREEVGGAVERALASGLPAVLDCRVRFEPHPSLPDFGRMAGAGMAPSIKA